MEEYIYHEEEYKGYIIKIVQDEPFESPREWENLGTMVCWHREYNLGDVQPRHSAENYIVDLVIEEQDKLNIIKDFGRENYWKEFNRYFVVLPIYMYDHSGIGLSTSNSQYPFNCPWDSGQLGFIYVSKSKALKEYNRKHWNKSLEEKVVNSLRGEVETYNDYLNGNLFAYVIYSNDEIVECVGGYYPEHFLLRGHDDWEYCLSEARSAVDCMVKAETNSKWEQFSIQESEQ